MVIGFDVFKKEDENLNVKTSGHEYLYSFNVDMIFKNTILGFRVNSNAHHRYTPILQKITA